jgi:hypothetical protein
MLLENSCPPEPSARATKYKASVAAGESTARMLAIPGLAIGVAGVIVIQVAPVDDSRVAILR